MTEKSEKKYIEAVGRRKTAIARVRGVESAKNSVKVITENGEKSLEEYFKTEKQRVTAMESLIKFPVPVSFAITVKLIGGGSSAQAEAVRHGIARLLNKFDLTLRKDLKKAGFLTRDQRCKERRKFGLKKARKAAQWSKR
jgi:small subunit ribosomal protein S9